MQIISWRLRAMQHNEYSFFLFEIDPFIWTPVWILIISSHALGHMIRIKPLTTMKTYLIKRRLRIFSAPSDKSPKKISDPLKLAAMRGEDANATQSLIAAFIVYTIYFFEGNFSRLEWRNDNEASKGETPPVKGSKYMKWRNFFLLSWLLTEGPVIVAPGYGSHEIFGCFTLPQGCSKLAAFEKCVQHAMGKN